MPPLSVRQKIENMHKIWNVVGEIFFIHEYGYITIVYLGFF